MVGPLIGDSLIGQSLSDRLVTIRASRSSRNEPDRYSGALIGVLGTTAIQLRQLASNTKVHQGGCADGGSPQMGVDHQVGEWYVDMLVDI